MTSEPIFDLAHLGHMELLTPKPNESLKFFVEIMGMTVSGRKGESVYLRGWDDYERYSLKLTASNTSGMEHMASESNLAPARPDTILMRCRERHREVVDGRARGFRRRSVSS